jgi:hypothetical protein
MTRSFTAATAGALVLLCPFGVGTASADDLNGDVIADDVCVPPESRDQAHADNAAAASRRAA